MKYLLLILLALPCAAQKLVTLPPGVASFGTAIVDNEEITVINLRGVVKYSKPAAQRRHDRLTNNVRKVYPIAREAEAMFRKMDADLGEMPSNAKRRAYINKMEQEIQKKYTPVLRQMTFSQGKILIKLIDRQTDMTSYDILLEMRGRFRASMWQGVAKLFDANLDASYDAAGEDREIEEIIEMIDKGLI